MIIKTTLYFAFLLAFGYAIVQGVESQGILTISWFNYYIELNIMFALVLTIAFIFIVQVMMHLLTLLGVLPSIIRYKSENKNLKNGLDNLKSIAISLSLGNKDKAVKMAKKNQKVIPDYPIFDEVLNLKSKTDVSNDIVDIRMAKNKIEEFLENYNSEKALAIVENILAQHPDSAWAKNKKYSILLTLGEFDNALSMLETLKKEKIISKEKFKLEASFIYYELALDTTEAMDSLKLAEDGMKLQPNFIKLVDHCAIIFLEMGETEKALKLLISLSKAYNQSIATLSTFKTISENLEIAEQIKWLNKYYKIDGNSVGCILAKAQSLLLEEKTEQAIKLLENSEQSKETLEFLAQVYKKDGNKELSIECLEKANLLEYIDPQDLIPEYQAWQNHNLIMDENDESCLGYEKSNNMMLEND
jgi:uncharacterized membrane-anchored protein